MFDEAKTIIDKKFEEWKAQHTEVDYLDPTDAALAALDEIADDLTADTDGGEDG